jgi:hypothetical protein
MNWYEKSYIAQQEEKQLNNIDELIHLKKYNLARRESYNLLSKYPNFKLVNSRLIILNHLLGDDERNVLYLTETMEHSDNYKIRSNLFECYYYMHKYQEAFSLLDSFMDGAKEEKLKYYRIYEITLMKKLGMEINLLSFEKNNYLLKQIIDYNYDLYDDYINSLISKRAHMNIKINQDIDIKQISHQIENIILSSKRSKKLGFSDIYIFYCPNFAIDKAGTIIDYIKVSVIPETNQILLIEPIRFEGVDVINQLELEKKNDYKSLTKTKRKSQIEKFNSRYSR